MRGYFLRRLLLAVPTVFGVITLVFLLIHLNLSGRAQARSSTGLLRWESWPVTRYVFAGHVALYRLFGGRWVGKHTLILTTTGRKSGRQRSTPLLYVRDGGDYIIVASNGGEDRYPGWWHNIRQNPSVQIQVGRKIIACRAVRASGEATPRLWAKLTAIYDGYRTYRGHTQRELTIFRLTPELAGHGLGEG